jgi:hypothetical protein
MSSSGDRKNELIHELGAKIIKDLGSRKPGWAHLVLVGKIEDDNPEMTGFAYLRDGDYEPVAPKDFSILDELVELRDAMTSADKKAPWRACLIRLDRNTAEIAIDFEYQDTGRWSIDFRNSKTRAQELKPPSA